jgi:hypothetical protein
MIVWRGPVTVFISVMMSVCGDFAAAAAAPARAEPPLRAAREALNTGDYARAVELYEQCRQALPSSAEV